MKKNITYYIILFISYLFSYDNFNQSFGTINIDNNVIDSPFIGGFNKPKIQWIDWDGDNDTDLFLLDEDGCIKVFENYSNDSFFSYHLVESCFSNINNINWFYFADFDLDSDFDLITQDSENLDMLLYYQNTNNIYQEISNVSDSLGNNIVIQSVMTPTFADIDNDNDLDFFVGNVVGTISFYENVGLIGGMPTYNFVTNFWEEIYIVGSSQQRHGASAIAFIDLDNDNDLDLAWGDYYQQSLYIINNIGNENFPNMDSENIINQYPIETPVLTAGLNMPSFTDIDEDGDSDLFVTVMSGAYGYQLINNFYFYENVSINEISDFQFITDNFISTFDALSDVNPEFFDYDNDNDMDMIIGTDFDPSSFPWVGKLMLFENIGLDQNNEPVWLLIDDEYLGDGIGNNLCPSTVDIDADGDFDLFVGNFNGTLQFFENAGSNENPDYNFIEYVPNIDLSGYSTPEFIDVDNDNDYDLLLGNMNGTIYFYENMGNQEYYDFYLITDNYHNIDVNFRSSPLAYDYDSDGDLDLYVGSGSNDLIVYENHNNSFDIDINSSIYNLGKSISPSIYYGSDNKGLVIGLSTGGMYYIPICNSDFNSDNSIDVIDVVLLILHILDNSQNISDQECLDLNNDLAVDILDVVHLINGILNI